MKLRMLLSAVGMLIMAACQNDLITDIEIESQNDANEPCVSFNVSTSELDLIANSFCTNKSRASEYTLSPILDEYGDTSIIIMNFPNNSGWVLVSNSKDYYPILAYSDEGSFSLSENMAPLYKEWEKNCIESIRYASQLPADSVRAIKSQWKEFETPFEPDNHPKSRYRNITHEDYQNLCQARNQFLLNMSSSYDNIQIYYPHEFEQILGPEAATEALSLAEGATCPLYEEVWEEFTYLIRVSSVSGYTYPNMVHSKWHQKDGFVDGYPNVNVYVRPGYEPYRKPEFAGCGPVALGQLMRYYQYPDTCDWPNMPLESATTTTSMFLYNLAKDMGCRFTSVNTICRIDSLVNTLHNYGYSGTLTTNLSIIPENLQAGRPVILSSHDSNQQHEDHIFLLTGDSYHISQS